MDAETKRAAQRYLFGPSLSQIFGARLLLAIVFTFLFAQPLFGDSPGKVSAACGSAKTRSLLPAMTESGEDWGAARNKTKKKSKMSRNPQSGGDPARHEAGIFCEKLHYLEPVQAFHPARQSKRREAAPGNSKNGAKARMSIMPERETKASSTTRVSASKTKAKNCEKDVARIKRDDSDSDSGEPGLKKRKRGKEEMQDLNSRKHSSVASREGPCEDADSIEKPWALKKGASYRETCRSCQVRLLVVRGLISWRP